MIDQPLPEPPSEPKPQPIDEPPAEAPQSAPTQEFSEQLPADNDHQWHGYEALAEQHIDHEFEDSYASSAGSYIESASSSNTSSASTSSAPTIRTEQDNKLSPQKLLIGLLMSRPELAKELDDIELFSHFKDADSQLLLRLARCLQSRPHFNIHQLTGHWLASYGQQEWQKLKDIAEQSTSVLSAAMREGNFDDNAELKACEDKLLQQQQRQSRQNKLKELKSKAFNELSSEEKALFRQLIQLGH